MPEEITTKKEYIIVTLNRNFAELNILSIPLLKQVLFALK